MSVDTSSSEPLLQLDRVNLNIHDTPILHDVSLSLHAGKTLGVIGESGSGKSMTALSIMQLMPRGSVMQGSVRFNSQVLNELPEEALCELRGSDIGMVFQEPMTALNPVKSIGDQVSESIRLHRMVSKSEAMELTRKTLERVGLPNHEFPLSRYPHELSGGQRQRVVIAIAVACKPKLLIADEPTTALDVTTQAGILDLLKSLQRDEGLALMLITHDLAVVSNMADDVLVMKQGRVIEQGNLAQVFGSPTQPYTRMLFEASALTQITRSQHSAKDSSAYAVTTTKDSSERAVTSVKDSSEHAGATRVSVPDDSQVPLLQVSNLVCEYPVRQAGWFTRAGKFRAVDSVSFDIKHGESVGLVGESGCGKSTLTRALLGLMQLHGGEILLNGESVSKTSKVSRSARQQMQVVFQDPYGSFNPRHKVSRLVSEPLFLLDTQIGTAAKNNRVSEVLESVGLRADDGDKYIHEFSGGQRQRIAIARALIIKPSLIILDEAVSALDVSVRAQVLKLLDTLANQEGLAYLFISHDLSVVQRVSDRVLVMRRGQIVERGNTRDVFDNPQHDYTQQLIAAAPMLRIS